MFVVQEGRVLATQCLLPLAPLRASVLEPDLRTNDTMLYLEIVLSDFEVRRHQVRSLRKRTKGAGKEVTLLIFSRVIAANFRRAALHYNGAVMTSNYAYVVSAAAELQTQMYSIL